jgi:pyrimidine-specific ribonucleoside hydrolase
MNAQASAVLVATARAVPHVAAALVSGGVDVAGSTDPAGALPLVAERRPQVVVVELDGAAALGTVAELAAAVPQVPLDLTLRCPAGPGWIEALAGAGPRCAALAEVITHYRAAFRQRYGIDAVAVHDAVAVLEAVLPGTLRTTPKPIAVACDLGPARGATVGMPAGSGQPVQVALDADTDGVLAEILERLRRLG